MKTYDEQFDEFIASITTPDEVAALQARIQLVNEFVADLDIPIGPAVEPVEDGLEFVIETPVVTKVKVPRFVIKPPVVTKVKVPRFVIE